MRPQLVSLTIFDGIPPQKEGEDPTIFWYWPDSIAVDNQLNEVGLYLTFIGFCRDFKSSKDCQYFETNERVTCLSYLAADVYVAASFEYQDQSTYRGLCALVDLFTKTYRMFLPLPERHPDNTVTGFEETEWKQDVSDMKTILWSWPYLTKMRESLDVWMLCETAIANAKMKMTQLRSAIFIWNGNVVHSSMNPVDTLVICNALIVRLQRLLRMDIIHSSNALKWIAGIMRRNDTFTANPRRVELSDGPAYIVALRATSEDLTMIFALSEPPDMNIERFSPLEDVMSGSTGPISEQCTRVNAKAETRANVCRDDRMYRTRESMRLSSKEKTDQWNKAFDEKCAEFIGTDNNPESLRLAARTHSGWFMVDKDDTTTTMIESRADAAASLKDFIAEVVRDNL